MYVAPAPFMTATLAAAPSGPAGVFHTVRVMRDAVNRNKVNPRILNAAVTATFHRIKRDRYDEAKAIFEMVRSWVRYVPDVLGVETFAEPWLTLERRAGDCDDQAALLASLYEAIGFPTRFVMGAYNDPAIFEHIYLQVMIDGQWFDVDPTENFRFGEAPPFAMNLWIEGI
jgi:transglutaminase-like putative cysteine protease